MPSQLLIQIGRQTISKWIDREVLRIGGDASCEVQIPGLIGPVATLQYHDGIYRLWSRGQIPVRLGHRVVEPEVPVHWKARRVLAINSTRITLQIQGDPKPSPPPLDRERGRTESSTESQSPVTQVKRAQRRQWPLVAVVLGLLVVWMTSGGKADIGEQEYYDAVVRILSSDFIDLSEQPTAREVQDLLQAARICESRRDIVQARRHYCEARGVLLGSDLPDKVRIATLNLVRLRLARLDR
ncbi:MAG: hypothetical protein KDA52_01490 [Planctomycetaceae bacterium]|nr:hypothetical protein [Planctomycetaceae bacterium]